MKILMFILSVAAFIIGCKEHSGERQLPITEEMEVEINFSCAPAKDAGVYPSSLTPQQERKVYDVNIYLYHDLTGKCTRKFVSGATSVSLKLVKGKYKIYAIANHGSDLGEMTRAQVENLQLELLYETDFDYCLPMSGEQEINVTGQSNIAFIILKRMVAKINVSVNVADAVAGSISLTTISLVNVPQQCYCFKVNTPSSNMIKYSPEDLSDGGILSFYMFENSQGVNPNITDQRFKSSVNAPLNATYLYIKGESGNKILHYYIYLGENNTSDFNVLRNRNYSLDINITGISETDWRVEVTSEGKDIDVILAEAVRSTVTFYPNMVLVGSNNTLEVKVGLNTPAEKAITVSVWGVKHVSGNEYNILSPQSFFRDTRITIPAGAVSASATFYLELRGRRDPVLALDYSHCYINQIESSDSNNYTYVSGYVKVEVLEDKLFYSYPPNY